ncbi:GntR family transcriptional regulator [Mycobacterium sp. 236(2023)]|uniref:GntR family transcriptional regulator n=1 Tax=Mycobacterium sp. 236(2023) TaxID=3038163 RepID=UPI0024157047|nr:GntR family transcriptional regulator [Mycobacterium sp. 236(2023)]MDG4669399.1 GntR family transcriptional regulator [Mycobacterium sp. 236(2023)]
MSRDHLAVRLQRRSSGEEVAAYLRNEIISGRLSAGERINQEEMATRLGVSRIPVREAIAILENEGRVETELHRGARVLPVDPESVTENTEVFGLIYAYVARRAAERVTNELDATLLAISEELTSAASSDEAWRAVGRYVDAISEIAVSARMNRILRRVRALVEVEDMSAVSPAAVEATRVGVLETIAFIRAGDGERAALQQAETQKLAAEHLVAELQESRRR